MKNFTRYLSLLAMAILTILPSWAGGVASLDEISNNAAYVIKSQRGYMVYAPNYAPDFAWCSNNTTNGAKPIDVKENEANNQWAIIKSPNGFMYLWNVGAKKFLYKKSPKTIFSDIPLGGDLNFLNSTGAAKADYPWVVAFGGNQLNMSTDQAASVFTNWNKTDDEGNMLEIRKVADLSEEVLAVANAAIAAYEKDILFSISSLDELNDAKSYYVSNPRGDWAYVPSYQLGDSISGTSMLVATTMKGVPANLSAAAKQFAFVKAASGNRYLYSVGAQKYVAVSTNKGETGTLLVDVPVQKINFLKGQASKRYPWVLALNEKQIGVSTSYEKLGGIITFWNDLKDEGNNVIVAEGDDFDGSALLTAVNAYEESLKTALAESVAKASKVLDKVVEGEFNATAEQQTALADALKATENADITKDDYNVLIANLNAAVEAIPQVVVPVVVVNPDPVQGKLKEVPAEVSFTFRKEIKSAKDALVLVGLGQSINIEASQIAVSGKVVTIKLPVEQLASVANFSLSFSATDINDKVITFGNGGEGYVEVSYEMEVPANTYKCSFIDPAEGEVVSLQKFTLTFANDAAMMGDNIGGVDATKEVVLKDKDGKVVAKGTISVDYDAWTSDAVITLDKPVKTLGSYTLVVPEGTVYNAAYNADEADKGVSKFGAIYNPELTFNYTVVIPAVVVDPDPANGVLKEVPAEVNFTFNKEIKTANEAVYIVGMSGFTPIDDSMITVKGKVVTIKLPVADMEGIPNFSLSFKAVDVDGKVITFGNGGEGYVGVSYDVEVPANSYLCTNITPAEGNATSLKTFTLTLTNKASMMDNIGGVDNTKEVVLKDKDGKVVAKGAISVDYDAWTSDAVITLDKEITELGTYTLVVPEGTFYNSSYNAEQDDKGVANFGAIYNPELIFTYSVAPAAVVVSPDPADGMLKEIPAEVVFTFRKDIKSAKNAAYLVGMEALNPIDDSMITVKGKVVTIKLPVKEMAGISGFSLSFEATDMEGNVITFGDGGEGYVGVTYDVAVPANTYKCTAINPAEGDVASLKEFKLTFTNDAAMVGDNIGGVETTKEVVLKDKEGQVVAKGTVKVDFDAWSSDAVITLDKEITAAGTYTLVVPEGTIYNSGYNPNEEDRGVYNFGAIYNPELVYTYNVISTGIDAIISESANVKVYNLNGVLVAKTLKNLPKGLYIVNGKKVFVK